MHFEYPYGHTLCGKSVVSISEGVTNFEDAVDCIVCLDRIKKGWHKKPVRWFKNEKTSYRNIIK